ncbi:MAG: hypothetical protein K1X64_13305 [Myxococcaceae bacterium]|nr:hypothetical protein [Myxococcaceae bacterium]
MNASTFKTLTVSVFSCCLALTAIFAAGCDPTTSVLGRQSAVKVEAGACGGLAGLQCPTGQICVDDPSDGCDLASGGVDCMGICKVSSDSPDSGHVADAGHGQFCGGLAGLQCPTGLTCVDDPSDFCDPQNGGADCGGICVAADAGTPDGGHVADAGHGQFCGGLAGLQCPGGLTCVDDPSDFCDPQNGGADCNGFCEASPDAGSVDAGSQAQICGGIGGFRCPSGHTCIDTPDDGCDPQNGDLDCLGTCSL